MRVTYQADMDGHTLRSELEDARATQEQCLASGANHSVWMKAAFDGADIACGYWKEDSGWVRGLLKGEATLQRIAAGSEAFQARILRVPCREAAEAEAMCQVWGDDRPAEAA